MARYSIDGQILTNIANAINEKTGETAAMTPEQMAQKIAGISSTTIEPLEIVKNGTYTAEEGKAFSPIAVNIEGNPNYVETINGTLANPWGSYNFLDLMKDANDSKISLFLTLNGLIPVGSGNSVPNIIVTYNMLSGGLPIHGFSTIIYVGDGDLINYSVYLNIYYKGNGTLKYSEVYNLKSSDNTYTTVSLPSNQSCTLTIIHHPLPESEATS